MATPRLVDPSPEYKASYVAALQEFLSESEHTDLLRNEIEHLEDYLARWKKNIRGGNTAMYWLVDGKKFIGSIQVRKTPTSSRPDIPKNHIYYDIRPSERNKGYGTTILKLGVEKARGFGLRELVLTCEASNIASQKIIEKNGGTRESAFATEDGKEMFSYKMRV